MFIEITKTTDLQLDRVIFLNVGQGDSILVTSNQQIGLIDAGPGNIVSERLSQYLPFNINTLDFVVLTHFDKDHIEGFIRLSKTFAIKNLYISKSNKENDLIEELKNIVISKNIPTYYLSSDTDFQFADFSINVVWPISDQTILPKDSNDNSIGIELKYGKCNVYTAGDLSSNFESESTKHIIDSNIEVLKLGHHGSRTSTSQEFIMYTQPDIAIVSAGENNSYGHPHKEVLDILSKNNISTFQTKNGDITTYLNQGDTIELKQENKLNTVKCF